jgi:glycosyltransferase involved in cell wall biosynthesis
MEPDQGGTPPLNDEPFITMVIPVLNEQESLVELVERIEAVFLRLGREQSFEIIVVDDGSTDGTAALLEHLGKEKPYLRALIFRANAGKSIALTAGFRAARGDFIVTMDGDLQDCPEDIPALIEKSEQGFDVVVGKRKRRNDGLVRKLGSRLFNATVARSTGLKLADMNCGFKILKREAALRLNLFGHLHRYLPVLAHLQGFSVTEAEVNNKKRKYGASRYPAFRLQGLFDLFSVLFLEKNRFNPLHFFGGLSALLLVAGAAALLWGAPLQFLGTGLLFFSLQSFLLGLVCDFILHHVQRHRVGGWIDGRIHRTVNQTPVRQGSEEEEHLLHDL